MANKTLTATVKLNTSSAEASLKKLSKKINAVQKAVTKVGTNSKLTTNINKAVTSTNKLRTATNKWANATNKVLSTTSKVSNTARKINTANNQASNSARKLGSAYRSANSGASGLLGTIKRLASTYLGVMGAKAIIETSDVITSSENRLNNIEGGNPKSTQEALDKIYAAAQRSRSGYGDMLSNVSKTMTLAGDSFQGNVDNAIRFQEIMSKAYTIGGASAAEQSSSMYQLVQALGSGVLQGDELRSLREGAPIAYKKIEEFAQGVLNTEDSLKDLASQGVITSDIVVAAIMGAEEEINKSFENTDITFAQAWDNIKNTATKAFEPVLQKLNDALNSDAGKAAIEGVTIALFWLADVIMWVFDLLGNFFTWCVDNWEWLKYVVCGVLLVVIALLVKMAAVAIWAGLKAAWGFLKANWGLLLIVAGIMAILYVYELWRQATITTTEAIALCFLIISAMALIAGLILMSIPLLILAVVLAVISVIIVYFAEFCGYVNVGIQAIVNAWFWMCNLAIGIWNWICAAGGNAMKGIANFAIALGKAIGAICTNIGIAFNNAWHGALSGFWDFVASCMEGLDWLAKPISKIAELFGKSFNYEDFTASVRAKADSHDEKIKDYVSVSGAWDSGMNTYQYEDLGEAWNKGWNTYDVFQDGWASDAYGSGYAWGSNIENMVNEWGSQFQTQSKNDSGAFTDLGKLLGINGNVIDPNDPKYNLSGGYDPSGANDDIQKALDEINGGVGDISDSMDLENDDLDFLRKIAEMEWRNEFTTAEIKVDMTNYNSVNGDRDLDGVVEYLADVLRGEMTNVAYGVHS